MTKPATALEWGIRSAALKLVEELSIGIGIDGHDGDATMTLTFNDDQERVSGVCDMGRGETISVGYMPSGDPAPTIAVIWPEIEAPLLEMLQRRAARASKAAPS